MNGLGTPGLSSHPALSGDRIAAARAEHGDAVDLYLEHLHMGDPFADNLVECFEDMPRREGYRMLMQAIDGGIDSVDGPPEELVALFEQLDRVPEWVDWDRMRTGSAKILQNALLPTLSLVVYALPYSYLATGNKPLVFSTSLIHNTARRYGTTTKFFTEVFMPGAMRRHADGFKFTVLTRVYHARVRRQILRSGKWDPSLGVPLNQAHMAMGTIILSFFVPHGIRRLGGRIGPTDMEGIMLIWRYVGHLFGIDPRMSFTSEEEARRLIEVGYSLEFDLDEDAARLSQALVRATPEILGIRNRRLASNLVGILFSLSRKLLGDHMADRLGYPKERRRLLCSLGISLAWLFERCPVLIPPGLRRYMGVRFWLDQGNYDLRMYRV